MSSPQKHMPVSAGKPSDQDREPISKGNGRLGRTHPSRAPANPTPNSRPWLSKSDAQSGARSSAASVSQGKPHQQGRRDSWQRKPTGPSHNLNTGNECAWPSLPQPANHKAKTSVEHPQRDQSSSHLPMARKHQKPVSFVRGQGSTGTLNSVKAAPSDDAGAQALAHNSSRSTNAWGARPQMRSNSSKGHKSDFPSLTPESESHGGSSSTERSAEQPAATTPENESNGPEGDTPSCHKSIEITASDPTYISMMESLCHSSKFLMEMGYPIRQLTTGELERKNRCKRCLKVMGQRRVRNRNRHSRGAPREPSQDLPLPEPKKQEQREENQGNNEEKSKCRYHTGTMANKIYTCCFGNQFSKPCATAQDHEAREIDIPSLQRNWMMHETPYETRDPRACVVIDCEMGVGLDGDSELIRVTAIDYYTSEVLIDKLVFPENELMHPNTRYSGVSFADLNLGRRNGTAILGRDAARAALHEFIDRDTILVGHSVNNDLMSLRWIHYRIVDTFLLDYAEDRRQRNIKAKEAREHEAMALAYMLDQTKPCPPVEKPVVPGQQPSRSLKTLSKTRLGRVIQSGAHDSLEDALASRDLLNWWLINKIKPEFESPTDSFLPQTFNGLAL